MFQRVVGASQSGSSTPWSMAWPWRWRHYDPL